MGIVVANRPLHSLRIADFEEPGGTWSEIATLRPTPDYPLSSKGHNVRSTAAEEVTTWTGTSQT